MRPVEEFRAGVPIQTHFYDAYGNETTRYVGGTAGIEYTSAYSTDGQSVIKDVDYIHTTSHTTSYDYNADGLVSQITTPINQKINFDYQNKNLLNRISAVVDNQTNANDITYDGPFISGLSHNGTNFQFVYDERNNISEVKVAGATLLSKTVSYSINGSYFTECAYANGQVIYKFYDKYDRLIKLSERLSGPVLAKFIYSDEEVAETVTEPTDSSLSISGSSKLRVVIDTTTNTRTDYIYDDADRLKEVKNQDITIKQVLDDFYRVEKVECSIGLASIDTNYEYSSTTDDFLVREEIPLTYTSNISTSYTRDSFKRPVSTTIMIDDSGYKTSISYAPRQKKEWISDGPIQVIQGVSAETNAITPLPPISGYWQITNIGTTPYVSEFKEYSMAGTTATLVRTDAIEYDANGNITKYGDVTYEYDKLNRLVRENNPGIDKTTTWCYDVGGNIVSRTEYAYTTGDLTNVTPTNTYTYAYATGWKDQLVSFNGQAIEYDAASNPTTYRGSSLTWERGRNLAAYHVEDDVQYFDMCYDASGKRVSKRLTYEDPAENEVTTYYIYNGNNLVCEKEDNGGTISHKYYLYNSQGVIGYVVGSAVYTYRKNLFGDIVAIYEGSTKVAEYAYDAWGNCTIVNEVGNIGARNPFRYRGYYWDDDLKLYYLMSRYYDPQVGRFISSADISALNPSSINGLNLYNYANNNPMTIVYNCYGAGGSAACGVGSTNSGYHGTISNSSNIFGFLGTLSTAFGFFDQWSGYIAGGLDGGLGFFGPDGFGFKCLGKYSDALGKFGKGMAIAGGIISWGNSIYNNFTNPNYTTGEAVGASAMDAAYYGITGVLKYKAGLAIGSFAVNAGTAVGSAAVGLACTIGLGFTGSLIVGLVVGGIVAIGIGVAGAYAIYYVGGLIDDGWEWLKKQIFE